MHLATIEHQGRCLFGTVSEEGFTDMTGFSPSIRSLRQGVEAGALDELLRIARQRPPDLVNGSYRYRRPITHSDKIFCALGNYADGGEPAAGTRAPLALAMRCSQCFVGHDRSILRPRGTKRMDFAGGIGAVIGRAGRDIAEERALSHVSALVLCNEAVVHDPVELPHAAVTQGRYYERSAALGPGLFPLQDPEVLKDLILTTHVNGELRQEAPCEAMIYSISEIVARLSRIITLVPGDILVAGTPAGTGAEAHPPVFLQPGDEVVVRAGALGTLRNRIAQER